jgi:tetratricopeptide (TPR) repeat protein
MTEDSTPKRANGEPPERPPTLIPPDATAREEQKPSRAPLLIAVGGLVLVIAALLVVLLPLMSENQTTPISVQETVTLKPQAPIQNQSVTSPEAAGQEAAEIEQLIGTWLQKQAEAEAENVAAWGSESYVAATTRGKECSQLLQEKQYLPAREACNEAIDKLNALMASKEVLLEEAVAAGLLALEQGNPEPAVEYFQQALAIDADEERATTGLRRAEHLPTVLRFMQHGQSMQTTGDPEGALRAFSEATTLDPEYAPAQQALARVKATIAEKEFQLAMSRALHAMTEGKTTAARTALQKAEAIKPGDRAVHDLQQQLLLNQRASRLSTLRQNAERLEREERWSEALKTCTEALSLDSNAAFASSCKERTRLRVELDNQIAAIFAKPERLFTDGPRKEARQTLLYASQFSPRGPILASQMNRLDALVSEAEAEIEVVIMSDGLTDVVIYHVGRLGLFQEKQLVLRTGNYTATGSRNGFRDVRQTLKVRPGSGKMVFTLRCEEPI